MVTKHKPQLLTLAAFVALYMVLGFGYYYFGSLDQIMPGQTLPPEIAAVPKWLVGLANSGIILVVYGLLGLAGYWLTIKSGLPGMYRENAGWRTWIVKPLVYGVVIGVILVIVDRLFATQLNGINLPHPGFPLSLVASASAGIGEEIMFRLFVMGLWLYLLNLVLRRWDAQRAAFWIANLIAALVFAAAHLPALMFVFGTSDLFLIPTALLIKIILLNSLLGLIAGVESADKGLVAAIGIHFWADVVWHVIWPLLQA